MAARSGDKKQGSSSLQEQSAPGIKEHLPYKNVYSSSNTMVLSDNGRVTHSNPGTTAAMQRSNTALSLSPQCSMFTEHNLPLPVNNTTDVSDTWQNWHPNESVDVVQYVSAVGDSFNLPNEASDTHGRQRQRLRGKIASCRGNAGSTVAFDNCSTMGTPGVLNEPVTSECEHYKSVASGGEPYGGMAGGDDPCGVVTSGGKPGGGHPYGGIGEPYGGVPGKSNPCGGMAGGGDLYSAVAGRGQLYGDRACWSKPYEGMFGRHDPYRGMTDGGNPYGAMAGGNDPLGGVACESEPLAGGGGDPYGGVAGRSEPYGGVAGGSEPYGGVAGGSEPYGGVNGGSEPYGGVAGGSEPYGGMAGGSDAYGPYGGMAGRSVPYDGVGGGDAPCGGLNELYNGLPPTAASSGLQDMFSRDVFDGIPYDENVTGGSRNKYSPTECINGPMYSNPLLSQACGPAESISNIRTKGELAQKQLEEAYQQNFTSLPSHSKTGDILYLGSGYDQELPTPTPQLTPDQSSTSQAGLTGIAVTVGNYSSSMTNAIPVVTGHTEPQGSKEGGELVTILSSSLNPKFGPNHVEDDDVWDLDYGVSDDEADVPWYMYLNSPRTVQILDQNRFHQQEISTTIGGISANLAHLSGSDLLDPISCSDRGTEIGGASIGGNHGNTSNDSTSTLSEIPSALAQSSSNQSRLDNTTVSSLSGGNTVHSTENHHLESQGGERFCHYPVNAQPGQFHREALSQHHSKPSSTIEDSFEMMKTMKKGSQSVHCQNTQSHIPAAFRDSRRDGASNEPFKPLVLTSTEEDQKEAPLLEDPDLASICDQVSSLPLPRSEPSITPSPSSLGRTPPEDAGRQNEAIDNTVTPNICSPVVSLVMTSNATVDVTRDATDNSQFSALQPSMATQGLCEKTALFQAQTYCLEEELITDITVRRDISGFQRDSACKIVQQMSESYQKCKECLNQQQTLNLNIAITTSARLCKIDFDFQRMRMLIHLPIQCVGLAAWLQEQDPPILERQHVVQQTFVLLAIFHGLGMLSLWGSFTVHVDGRYNQAYVKIEILKMLTRMQQVMCNGHHDPRIDDVEALQLLLKMSIQPVLCSPHAMLSPKLRSRLQAIDKLMSDPSSCVSHVADLGRCFGERRFCQLQVKVGEEAISVFCMEQESLSEAVKDIQSMLPKCWTWQLRLVADYSIVMEEVARADCPVIHLKFVPIQDEYIKP